MATILALRPRLQKCDTKQQLHRAVSTAHVIIFPGVRYERMPEAANMTVKSGRKNRKSA